MGEIWTPLPVSSYREVARLLRSSDLADARESGRIALEALIAGDEEGAPRIWHGHGPALLTYVVALCDEWEARGFRDGLRERVIARVAAVMSMSKGSVEGQAHEDVMRTLEQLPRVDLLVQEADRAALMNVDPEWYGQYGWRRERAVNGAERPVTRGSVGGTGSPQDELAERRAAKAATAQKERRKMATRGALVDELREKGYEGPVSYTKTRLEEMVATLESGGTIEVPKRGRKSREGESGNGSAQEGD